MRQSTIWFTSDTHFGHENIIQHCSRPFDSVREMDEYLLDRINECVSHPGDVLYHLGDFAFWQTRNLVNYYRSQIKCKQVFLVRGNHDTRLSPEDKKLFTGVYDIKEVKWAGQKICLCHYAMRTWPSSHKGSWHLYGHSHGKLLLDPNLKAFDTGVDCQGYRPIAFEEVQALISLM